MMSVKNRCKIFNFQFFSQEHFTPRSANHNELIDGCGDIYLFVPLKTVAANAPDVVFNFKS